MDGALESKWLASLKLDAIGMGVDGSDRWNKQDILGRTPLHVVCQSNDDWRLGDLVKQMLDAGADPGLTTIWGHTPLHYAATKGFVEVCMVLLARKSTFNIGAEDERRETALDYAVINKHQDIVDLLSSHYEEAGLNEELEKARRVWEHVKK